MKKIISVLIILCVVSVAFAADDVEITFKGMSALDNRSSAMGGSHVADTSDYFTLLRNPAGLAFSGRHNLIGITNINVGGPFEEVLNLYNSGTFDNLDNMEGTELIEPLSGLIADKKLNFALNIGGPLAIGGTYDNGFGWGLFDQILIGMSAPSTIAKANMEVDLDFVLGYGHKFSFGLLGDLAVGISTDIYTQTPYMSTKANLLDILGSDDITAALTDSMALASTAGVNVNAGVQYVFLDFLSAGLVYNNFFGAVMSKDLDIDTISEDPMTVLPSTDNLQTAVGAGTLDFGVGVDIPTFWSLGIISDFTVYADVKDLVATFKNDPLGKNPILNMSVGTEVVLLDCISARAGISDTYLNAGIGLRLLGLHLDASIYGKELGNEPGETSQLNGAISIGIRH